MKLEEELHQKKFKSEYQKLMVNLLYTGNWAKTVHARFLKQYDLTIQQFNVLRILRGQHPKPATVNLLIDRMLDKMSNASRLVEKLRQKGLVERQECKADRRQADVFITEAGLGVLEEIDNEFPNLEARFNKIGEKEVKQLNELLDALRG